MMEQVLHLSGCWRWSLVWRSWLGGGAGSVMTISMSGALPDAVGLFCCTDARAAGARCVRLASVV